MGRGGGARGGAGQTEWPRGSCGGPPSHGGPPRSPRGSGSGSARPSKSFPATYRQRSRPVSTGAAARRVHECRGILPACAAASARPIAGS